MKKKIILILVLALMCTFVFTACNGTDSKADSIVKNAGFESFNDTNTAPTDWTLSQGPEDDNAFFTNKYINDNTAGSSEYIPELGSTQFSSSIGSQISYTYLSQKVKLTKGKTYKLSAWIKTKSKVEGQYTDSKYVGARVGFLEDQDFSGINVKTANNAWTQYACYITPATARELTLVVGIGDPNQGKAKGTAVFDDVQLVEVDPDGLATTDKIYTVKHGSSYSLSDAKSSVYIAFGVIIALLAAFLGYYVIRRMMAKNTLEEKLEGKKGFWLSSIALFVYTLLGAFIVRFIIVLSLQGQGVDTSLLSNLAIKLSDTNPTKFFSGSTSNAPLGVLYTYWILGGFSGLANIQYGTIGMGILIRMPMIIADIITCYMIFNLANRFYKSSIAAIFAGMFAIMPVMFTASSAWGMTMSITICLLVATFISMLDKKFIAVPVLYMFAFLFDYIAVFFAPIILAYLVYYFVKERESRVKIGISLAGSFIGFILFTIPFSIEYLGKGDMFFIFKKMWNYFAEMSFISADSFSMYAIFGLNNKSSSTTLNVFNGIFIVLLALTAVYLFIKNKDRLVLILTSAFVMIAAGMFGAKSVPQMFVLGVALLFVFSVVSMERRVTWVSVALSVTSFLNIAGISANGGYLSNNPNMQYIPYASVNAFLIVFGIIQLALIIYLGYLVYDIAYRERQFIIQPTSRKLGAEISYCLKSIGAPLRFRGKQKSAVENNEKNNK